MGRSRPILCASDATDAPVGGYGMQMEGCLMPVIDTRTITTAITGVASSATGLGTGGARGIVVQVDLAYGSGGTSGVVYVQTSLDAGVTWCDVVNMTWATASKSRLHNLSSRTPVAPYAPTDGTLASDTTKDGIIGAIFRTKVSSVGTFAGGTTLITTITPEP